MPEEEIITKAKAVVTSHLSSTGNPRDPFEKRVIDSAKLVDDLGADSLDTVELAIALEEEFDVDLRSGTQEIIQDDFTFGQVVQAIKTALDQRDPVG